MSDTSAGTNPGLSVGNIVMLLVMFVAGAAVGRFIPWPDGSDAPPPLRTDPPRFAVSAGVLDERFKDIDGDLVADAPTDPAALRDPETLAFSYLATDDQLAFSNAWSDFLAHLSKVTGRPAEYVAFASSAEQAGAMAGGRLHLAAFNTGAVPLAVNSAGFVPFCAVATPLEPRAYQMEIIVAADSPIKTPADLRGKTLCLTDESSNAGCKAPIHLLRKEFGLEPARDYSLRYSGGYVPSLTLVSLGDVDAAPVANSVLARFLAARTSMAGRFRSIYKSTDFPTAAIGHAHDLDPALVGKIKEAFDTFAWKDSSLAAQFPDGRFEPVSYKQDWEMIREIDRALAR